MIVKEEVKRKWINPLGMNLRRRVAVGEVLEWGGGGEEPVPTK